MLFFYIKEEKIIEEKIWLSKLAISNKIKLDLIKKFERNKKFLSLQFR